MGTGCPPVRVNAQGLPGGKISISGAVSSQYLTALLMAAPLARDEEVCQSPHTFSSAWCLQRLDLVSWTSLAQISPCRAACVALHHAHHTRGACGTRRGVGVEARGWVSAATLSQACVLGEQPDGKATCLAVPNRAICRSSQSSGGGLVSSFGTDAAPRRTPCRASRSRSSTSSCPSPTLT
jgi:EPSP synthase (3-phosphoshikimate 1-carboxyvinyltransferase)